MSENNLTNHQDNILYYLGIGLFVFMTLTSLSSTLNNLVENLLIFLEAHPVIIFALAESVDIIVFAILLYITFSWLFRSRSAPKNVLIGSIAVFFIVSLGAMMIKFLATKFMSLRPIGTWSDYYQYQAENPVIYIARGILRYINYIIFVLFIWNAKKWFKKAN